MLKQLVHSPFFLALNFYFSLQLLDLTSIVSESLNYINCKADSFSFLFHPSRLLASIMLPRSSCPCYLLLNLMMTVSLIMLIGLEELKMSLFLQKSESSQVSSICYCGFHISKKNLYLLFLGDCISENVNICRAAYLYN